MGKNAGQVAFRNSEAPSQLTVRVDMGLQPNNQKALISDNMNELRASRQEVRLLTP